MITGDYVSSIASMSWYIVCFLYILKLFLCCCFVCLFVYPNATQLPQNQGLDQLTVTFLCMIYTWFKKGMRGSTAWWQPLSGMDHTFSLHFQGFFSKLPSSPGGELILFSLYGQPFPRYGPIFKNFHIWAWELEFEKKIQKLHILPLSIPEGWSFYSRGLKLTLFSLCGQGFSRYRPVFKIAILPWKLEFEKKFQKLHMHIYRQSFSRCKPIFKIPIFWHET